MRHCLCQPQYQPFQDIQPLLEHRVSILCPGPPPARVWQCARPECRLSIPCLICVIGHEYPTGQAEASNPACLMTFARVIGCHMCELGCYLLSTQGIEHPFVEDGCTLTGYSISVKKTFRASQDLSIAIW